MAQYRVEVTEPAYREIEETEDWIAVDSPLAAERWFAGLFDALRRLGTMPAGCPVAPENEDHAEEIRQLIYGQHRVLFTIQAGRVAVLHVRHGRTVSAALGVKAQPALPRWRTAASNIRRPPVHRVFSRQRVQ